MFRRLAIPLVAIAAVGFYFSLTSETPVPKIDPDSKRQITSGKIIGSAESEGTQVWRGIPYAQAPVGELRWKAPRPTEAWSGEKHMLSYSERCPQLPIEAMEDSGDKSYLGDEDCLYLNVAAPSFKPDAIPKGEDRLPVMVWIHGGGNVWGATSQYDAFKNLAKREEVIVVSMNYRLGILGWLHHPALIESGETPEDSSGNYGTLDIVQSLKWVQENIEAFGGNPDNVTVFGESAGGRNVFSLLASPAAKGLFHRAIIQSGMPISYSVAEAQNFQDDAMPGQANSSRELINSLLIANKKATTRDEAKAIQLAMSNKELREFLYAQDTDQLFAEIKSGTTGEYYMPTIIRDGHVLAKTPIVELFRNTDDYNAVPIMVGTTRDEMKSLMMGDPVYIEYQLGILPKVKDPSQWDRDTGYLSAMWKVLGADEPASLFVEGGNDDVYVYQFNWDEMTSNFLIDWKTVLGAAHSLEIAFVMTDYDGLMTYMPFPIIDDGNFETASVLAEAMSSYWGQFAHNGSPGKGRLGNLPVWKSWGSAASEQQSMIMDVSTDGGLRMAKGSFTRENIRERFAAEQLKLGDAKTACALYDKLFNENPYFSKRLAEQTYEPLVSEGCEWETRVKLVNNP